MTARSVSRVDVAVWAVWLVMFASTLGAIAVDGRNIPFAEDWGLVAPLTGHEPNVLAWLWAQNSEHRLPLPRAAGLALVSLTRDFRAGMVLNASVLGAISLCMMLVARRLRGGVASYADAFFPLLFLHLGHWDNIVWSWQMQFVLASGVTCVLLLVIVAHRGNLDPRIGALAGAALIALPLSGATGLVFAPPLALWAACVGVHHLRDRTAGGSVRRRGAILLGSVIVALLLMGIYFVGWNRPSWAPVSPSLDATLSFAAKFTAFGLGPAAAVSWRLSELVAFLVLLATGVMALAAVMRSEPSERMRLAGLFLFMAGAVVLALAIGAGRAGHGRMSPRYALLGAPVFCLVYFTWELYGLPRVRPIARTALLLIALVALPLNTRAGVQRRDWFGQGFRAIEHDLRADVPSAVLAKRHHMFLQQSQATLAAKIVMLERAHFGPFARAAVDGNDAGESR